MKIVTSFNQFVNESTVTEARRGTIHSAAKKASYPVTLVATEKGKVVDQKLVGTPMIVPAAFNMMQEEFPNATISVESKTGQIVFSESVVTEAKFVKDFNRDVLNAKTKEEVLELYPNAEFFIGKSDHFFGELDDNLFFKAYYTKAQEEFEIKSVYSEKGSNYVHLYNESVEISEGRYDKGKMARTHVVYAFNIQRKSDNAYQSFRVAVEKGSDAEERAAELLSDHIGKDLKKMTDGSKALNPEFHDIIEESAVTEAEVKSDEEFQEYAFTVLKKAFGEEFDEEKGQKTVDGILAKADGDYGVAVGILTSSLG